MPKRKPSTAWLLAILADPDASAETESIAARLAGMAGNQWKENDISGLFGDEMPGETIHAIYVPMWSFGDVRRVGRKEWLEGWQESGARPETVALAKAMTAKGFDHATGGQWHPKTASVIAKDAGCSAASAKRFLRKGRQSGRLTPTGDIVTLVAGKRSTPLYVLTVPGRYFGNPFREGIPDAARADLETQVAWGAVAEAMAAVEPHLWDVPNVLPCPF